MIYPTKQIVVNVKNDTNLRWEMRMIAVPVVCEKDTGVWERERDTFLRKKNTLAYIFRNSYIFGSFVRLRSLRNSFQGKFRVVKTQVWGD